MNDKLKSGFTLIETLVVIGILAIIVVVGSSSFFSILKGSTKTKTATLVKQNGDYAMNVMTRMIRNAKGIVGFVPENYPGPEITIDNPDGETTIFLCDSNDDGSLASNSASLMSSQVKVSDCSSVFNIQYDEEGLEPDVVTIDFTLSTGDLGRPEEEASMRFKTTVILRNIAED